MVSSFAWPISTEREKSILFLLIALCGGISFFENVNGGWMKRILFGERKYGIMMVGVRKNLLLRELWVVEILDYRRILESFVAPYQRIL